jgi:hypothetical protein
MRIIETILFEFNELSAEAKENAIEQVRNSYYEYNDFAEWAKDDCYLFNPPHKEIEEYNLKEGILLSNNRQNIYFSTDRNWFLDCQEAIAVENADAFLDWLGIQEDLRDKLDYNIFTPRYRNADTEIEFEWLDGLDNSMFNDVLDSAQEKFKEHINNCLKRIESGIDYHFTDEAIIEYIETNEIEFKQDGTKF